MVQYNQIYIYEIYNIICFHHDIANKNVDTLIHCQLP
jgi:hypothetical protein